MAKRQDRARVTKRRRAKLPRRSERAALVKESGVLYRRLWPDIREIHACLFHAVALQVLMARRFGVRSMLQAGSAQWPRVVVADDDGEICTHFGYQWNGVDDPATATLVSLGILPELHVWLALSPACSPLVSEGILIDPTTGSWVDRAKLAGFDWTAPKPPRFLWVDQGEMHKRWPDYGWGRLP